MKKLSLILLLLSSCDTHIPVAVLRHIEEMCKDNGGISHVVASAPTIVRYYCRNELQGVESTADRKWEK